MQNPFSLSFGKEPLSLINRDLQKIEGVASIRKCVDMSSNQFSVYRDRLLKKGIIFSPDYGRLDFSLPRFERFIKFNI